MPSHHSLKVLLGENNATSICTCTVHASTCTCSTHWHNIGTDIYMYMVTSWDSMEDTGVHVLVQCILYAGFISGFHSRGGQTPRGKLQLWVNANPGGNPILKIGKATPPSVYVLDYMY